MAKQCLTRRHTPAREFQRWTRDRCVGRYFLTRLPPEGRSERGALVGVLVDQNGGCRKILSKKLSVAEYFDDGCGLLELTTRPRTLVFSNSFMALIPC